MARPLVLHILALFLFITVSYSGSEETRELPVILISSRRVLTETPTQFSTSPDHSFVKTVGATAMGSLATAGVFTFFFRKCSATRKRHKSRVDSAQRINIEKLVMKQKGGTMSTGTILDHDYDDDDLDELDLLYWKKLESGQLARNFSKVMMVNPIGEDDQVRTGFETELPWQPYRVSAPRKLEHGLKDQVPGCPNAQQSTVVSSTITGPLAATTQPPSPPPPHPALRGQRAVAPPPPPPPPPMRHPLSVNGVVTKNVGAETKPPTPLLVSSFTRASPPTPTSMPQSAQPRSAAKIPQNKIPAPPPPPPPPIPPRKTQAQPPRSPIIPVNKNPRRRSNSVSIEKGFTAEDDTITSEVKLKPLHWDKVVANTEHSMVWDEINNGSFRFDDELMVSLFGYTAAKEKVAGASSISGSTVASSPALAQNFILDPRKSQNIAIVLKSLSVSRKEILDALLNGDGLSSDQLEKLSTLSPTQDETMRILKFDGNPTKLATAESFLYHILKALPSAFTRIDAMLFRSIYDPEILMLGLPILGGLSAELSHVKKAAAIEYESFVSVCSSLTNQVSDIKKLVTGCQNERGGFVLEMKCFLEGCEEELKLVGDEQMRVLELVKRTTEYYQAGASKEKGFNSFHLFKIIKDFLDMVDQVCVDITHKSKTKKMTTAPANASPPSSPAITNLLKFPTIQAHFFHSQPKNPTTSDSDSEGDF